MKQEIDIIINAGIKNLHVSLILEVILKTQSLSVINNMKPNYSEVEKLFLIEFYLDSHSQYDSFRRLLNGGGPVRSSIGFGN